MTACMALSGKLFYPCDRSCYTFCFILIFFFFSEIDTAMVYFSKARSGVGSNMIQSYMERRLQGLHDTSSPSVSNYKDKILSFLVGALTIILLPYLHLGKPSTI